MSIVFSKNAAPPTNPATIAQQASSLANNLANYAKSAAGGVVDTLPQVQPTTSDFRARLDALDRTAIYSGGGIMAPLIATGGILFPYSPTISFSQAVDYSNLQLVHSNTDYPAYTRTPNVTLSVTGKFTVQNQSEGAYAVAVIHFLRTVSKSYFGETDAKSVKAGLPPPVLLFSAYGQYIYNRLRCVLKSHSWSFDESMDTIAVSVSSGGAQSIVRMPAMFSIQMELMVVQTPTRMRTGFNFNDFASGKLMDTDGGWI